MQRLWQWAAEVVQAPRYGTGQAPGPRRDAEMPPAQFGIRSFSVANAQTFAAYAAPSAVILLCTGALQLGW
jgi:hypothetical protein